MASIQDSLTIGIVLFLLIAALGVYVWLRFQQVETRLTLTESILLDMKMINQSFSQFPPAPAEEMASPAPETFHMKTVSYNASPVMSSSKSPIINISKMDPMMDTMNEVEPLTELLSSENDFPSVLDEVKKEMGNSSSGDITIHQSPSSFSGDEADYNGMTLKDLRSLAKTRSVSGTGSMNRGQLISVLQEKDTSANEPMQMEYENEVSND